MTHSYGKRKGTRGKFSQGFRRSGAIRMQKYLTTYKRGQFVDIVVDASQHKGMPYQLYHGTTGRVFNVNPRSVGVELKKVVQNRQVLKRLHLRVEHLRPSKCREAFIQRCQDNDQKKTESNKQGKRISTKRIPVQPKPVNAEFVQTPEVTYQHPKQYVEIV